MSRVGSRPVAVLDGVDVTLKGNDITVKGKLGQQSYTAPAFLAVEKTDDGIRVSPRNNSKEAKVMWGTAQRLIQNMIEGVANGFTINLEIVGVGYRAAVQGKDLVLQLGFSHEVRFPIPDGITIKAEKPTSISVFGGDKQQVGQVAALIRNYRRPEPYKGKGIRYEGERILRKEGKKK